MRYEIISYLGQQVVPMRRSMGFCWPLAVSNATPDLKRGLQNVRGVIWLLPIIINYPNGEAHWISPTRDFVFWQQFEGQFVKYVIESE
jgi:hypothetical protein